MLFELKQRLARLRSQTEAVMLLVASVIGFGLYGGFGLFIGESGDLFLEAIKGSVSIAIACTVYMIGKWCFDIIAALDRPARKRLLPATVSGVVIVLNVSTYVLVVKLGHDSFTTAHMAEHLAKAAQDKDNVIAALNRFTSLASETDQCSSVLTSKQAAERKGTYSGYASQGGALVDYFGSAAAECAAVSQMIRESAQADAALIAKLDASIAAQQAAADDTGKPVKERVATLRAASEQFRNSVIEGLGRLPVAAVKSLAKSLLAPVGMPALSRVKKVAEGQMQGLSEAKKVQEQIGNQLLSAASAFDEIIVALPAVFKLPSASQLPWIYGRTAVPLLAIAAALDLSIFWFAFANARTCDWIREAEKAQAPDQFAEVGRLIEAVRRLEASFQGHISPPDAGPFPAASKLRAKTNGALNTGKPVISKTEEA